ncbi:katanin p60 ATPase-containing subunit A-like 1, partial [Salvelinus sp. IW2-2015]|uniref:katanin p60 ATPase-containing subunit A-like 1 n=1 Tax=Salvelinus sp. IW2-2015 TaxID=2691554 RepID=UPI0038D377B5
MHVCVFRAPTAVKRPNSGVKPQQRKDSPGMQPRGAPGGRGQTNPKTDRPAPRDAPRGTKVRDDKGKKAVAEGAGDGELKKFDGSGYDSDLVEALERDIVSRNPNIHWIAKKCVRECGEFCACVPARDFKHDNCSPSGSREESTKEISDERYVCRLK